MVVPSLSWQSVALKPSERSPPAALCVCVCVVSHAPQDDALGIVAPVLPLLSPGGVLIFTVKCPTKYVTQASLATLEQGLAKNFTLKVPTPADASSIRTTATAAAEGDTKAAAAAKPKLEEAAAAGGDTDSSGTVAAAGAGKGKGDGGGPLREWSSMKVVWLLANTDHERTLIATAAAAAATTDAAAAAGGT